MSARLALSVWTVFFAVHAGEARARDAELLHLRAGSFDPLTSTSDVLEGGLEEAPPLRPGLGDRYRLVQFSGKITRDALAALERDALAVIDHVPSHALIVRLPHGDAASLLDRIPGVRWAGTIAARYKVDPELAAAASHGLERLALDVGLYADEEPDGLVTALEARFRTVRVDFVKEGKRPRITLEVSPAEAPAVLSALATDPAVAWILGAPRLEPTNDQIAWIGQSFDMVNGPAEAAEAEPAPYALSATIWNRGLHGEGQILGLADTGLEHAMCQFTDLAHPVNVQNVAAPAPLALDLAHRKILAYNAPQAIALQYDDSFRHGTHTSGTAVGDDLAHLANGASMGHDHGDGVAPAAKLVFEDISGNQSSVCSTSMSVPSLENVLLQEYQAGARVSSNSWGSAVGQDDATSFEADAGVFDLENMLVVVSAGNRGNQAPSMLGLARCKNCLTVGAGEHWEPGWPEAVPPLHPEHMTSFSSRGPTSDGRTKPDITAPGYRVNSARLPVSYFQNTNAPECDDDDPNVCFPNFGGCYLVDPTATCGTFRLNGTSMATPAVAGLALLARQYFTEGFYPTGTPTPSHVLEPTAALLKAVMINGARNMTGRLYTRNLGGAADTDLGQLADAPSNVQGWGRATLDDALYFPGDSRRMRLLDLPHAAGLATDEHVEVTFEVISSAEPLKLTLVWSDAPSSPLALDALVNDLDLVLVAPDGRVYRGNQWTPDNINLIGDRESRPNAPGRDDVNNVEGILIDVPIPGVYSVEIHAFEVTSGPAQGAALVITGALEDAGGPPPVPDGTFGSPVLVAAANATKTELQLTWDAVSCPATDYHVIHGALSSVAALDPLGSACDLGNSGSALWTAVPSGDLWFLVVADDGAATEGSWGVDSSGALRLPGVASGECSLTERDDSVTCD